MGTCTDTYVEMLQQDLQHHYRKHFEISEELGEALMASEAKDEELTAAGQLLNLQMDATAQVEKKLVDALGVLSDRDIEIERLTFALKDKDEELGIARRTIENLDANSCVLYSENQRLETQFGAVKTDLDAERNNTAQVEKKLVDALRVLSDRDIEVERLTFALKDNDNERDSLLDTQEQDIDDLTQKLQEKTEQLERANLELEAKGEHVDVLMAGIKRLARKKEKDTKQQDRLQKCEDSANNLLCQVNALWERLAEFGVESALQKPTIDELWTLVKIHKEDIAGIGKELAVQGEMLATLDRHDALISKAFGCIDNHSDSIYKQQQSIDNLWLYVQGIAAHINTGSSQENP